jgi:hypothetical protein
VDVWIVEGGMNYEGSNIFGVLSTESKAERLCDEIKAKSIYDWVGVTKYVVDRDEPEVRFADFT